MWGGCGNMWSIEYRMLNVEYWVYKLTCDRPVYSVITHLWIWVCILDCSPHIWNWPALMISNFQLWFSYIPLLACPLHTLESMWQDMKTALSLLKSSSQRCIKTWLGYTFFHTLSLTSSLDLLSSGLGGGFCCPSLLTWWPPPTQGLLMKAGGAEPITSSAVTGSPFKDHEDTPSYHYYRVAMGWAALEVFWHSHKDARSY